MKQKAMRMRESREDRIFGGVVLFFLIMVLLITIYPLYFTVIASFSDAKETALGHTYLVPRGFTTIAYKNVFKNAKIWSGYANTIFITTVGTLWALTATISCAYAMSRKNLRGAKVVMGMFVFTMYFGGGLIPFALLIRSLGLYNSLGSLIIPSGFSVYNMIVARTFFTSNFPDEIYEAAKVDGAGELAIFVRIALPISGAIIAVIALFNAVGFWNSYFNALMFISDSAKWPLQLVLRGILTQESDLAIDMEWLTKLNLDQAAFMMERQQLANTIRYAIIVFASLPMLIAYPFVQKYFVKGVLIGSIK